MIPNDVRCSPIIACMSKSLELSGWIVFLQQVMPNGVKRCPRSPAFAEYYRNQTYRSAHCESRVYMKRLGYNDVSDQPIGVQIRGSDEK